MHGLMDCTHHHPLFRIERSEPWMFMTVFSMDVSKIFQKILSKVHNEVSIPIDDIKTDLCIGFVLFYFHFPGKLFATAEYGYACL